MAKHFWIYFSVVGFVILLFVGGYFIIQQTGIIPQSIGMIQYVGTLTDERWYNDISPKPVTSSEVRFEDYNIIVETKEVGQVLGEPYCIIVNNEDIPNQIRNILKQKFGMSCCNTASCGKSDCSNYGAFSPYNNGYHCCDQNPDRCFMAYNVNQFTEGSCLAVTYDWQYETCNGKFNPNWGGSRCYENCWNGWQNKQTGTNKLGGLKQNILYENTNENPQCWYKINIYKNNDLIKTLDWDTNAYKGQNRLVDLPDLRAMFMYNYIIQPECIQASGGKCLQWATRSIDYRCKHIDNTYQFKVPIEKLDFVVEAPEQYYFESGLATVKIKVTNNWKALKGNLIVDYEVPTAIGSAKKRFENIVDVNLGENEFIYEVPSSKVTDQILVTPQLDILMSGSSIYGVNGMCYRGTVNQHLNECQYILVAEVKDETHTIQIIPKPIYIEVGCPTKQCPNGYNCQEESGLCLRTDIIENKLTCMQLGCPVIEGHNYQCTSSGICAETVFVQKKCLLDSDCPSDTKCDVGSGLCIEEHIFEKILQCSTASDCPNPCIGKTISCENNKCTYSGECKIHELTCKELGCPKEYICDESGICKKEIDCKTLGCPEDYECNEKLGVCEKETINIITKIPIYVWFIIGFLVVLVIGLVIIHFKRKKKKKKK